MEKSQKWTFLKALIITLIVFNIGIYLGYKLETSRIDKINDWYLESELELLDQRIQKEAFESLDLNCELMIQENIDFADRIFEKALVIKEYEEASRINQDIVFQHQRYDLLRTLFWMNSINIKEKCRADYHNFVYFYQYHDPTIEQDSEQKFFSNLLGELKNQKAEEVMLIPIAADMDLPSVDLLLDKYEIEELPTILVDEKIKITQVESMDDILKYVK